MRHTALLLQQSLNNYLPTCSRVSVTVLIVTTLVLLCVGKLRGLTPQQLLLLRQSTLHPTSGTPTVQPLQTQTAVVQQKLSLPSGIEQLRATVASAASVLPRFAGIAATSGGTVKTGITGGRTFQTEEVIALLKQQSIRMSATQPAQLPSKPQQVTSTVKTAPTTSTGAVTQQNITPTTTVASTQNYKAHIQALAASQQKISAVQQRTPTDRK